MSRSNLLALTQRCTTPTALTDSTWHVFLSIITNHWLLIFLQKLKKLKSLTSLYDCVPSLSMHLYCSAWLSLLVLLLQVGYTVSLASPLSSKKSILEAAPTTTNAAAGYPVTTPESIAWAIANHVHPDHAATHSLFGQVAAYLRDNSSCSGSRAACAPFCIRGPSDEQQQQLVSFDTQQLKAAIENDFLDAGEGSTNANTGWRMQPVGGSRAGPSFQESRLLFSHVKDATGTVIFNSAGAYISDTLAATSMAALDGLDGAVSGVCLNMYVTTRGDAKLSAPPHTDNQDVVVIQTQGRKHWRIYSPPTSPSLLLDPFARGKGADDMPVHILESIGSKLLLDVTLEPGDVLFVPARFPHTTDTLSCYDNDVPEKKVFSQDDWSIHLTVGMDSHVWSMNYLSMRRMGLCKFSLQDGLARKNNVHDDDYYVGMANSKLGRELTEALFSSMDSGMLSSEKNDRLETIQKVAHDLFSLNAQVNTALGGASQPSLSLAQCVIVVTYFCDMGQSLLEAHRDMYTCAIAEEQTRNSNGWSTNAAVLSNQQQLGDRLSIFRVPQHFEKMDVIRDELRTWAAPPTGKNELGAWAASQNVMQGDQVQQADGVGSWLPPSKVIQARADGLFDLQQFDGSVNRGVRRQDIKGPYGIGIFV